MEIEDLFEFFEYFEENLQKIISQTIVQRDIKIEDVLIAIQRTINDYERE